jgi:hypothetical protein
MSVLNATDGTSFPTVSAAILASSAGDVILIPTGLYVEEFPHITHSLTLQGVGGMAQLRTPNPTPANDRAVLMVPFNAGADLTVRNLEIFGASRPTYTNGAGILFEIGNGSLRVYDSWFHHNENGILVGDGTDVVEIVRSEFSFNGNPTYAGTVSPAHNLYVNMANSLTVTDSFFHSVRTHHELKSRAAVTTITNSRFVDGPDSQASYSIDLPNGGIARIENNVIVKGPLAPNRYIIHFGGEPVTPWPNSTLDINGNFIINERADGATALFNQSRDGPAGFSFPASMTNNTFYNVQDLVRTGYPPSDLTLSGNVMLTGAAPAVSTLPPWQSGTSTVPEPTSVLLLTGALVAAMAGRWWRGARAA